MAQQYYDGARLLSMTDLDGNRPEIYLCTSNRSAGKTTYFSRLLVNRFIDSGDKFCLFYRFSYELTDVADKFFKEINQLFFPKLSMEDAKRGAGKYVELYLTESVNGVSKKRSCGYAVALNAADNIKKLSHFFADVKRIMFDEFQSETNCYCPNEISKFISLHTSIARGGGKQSRYVPVYMLSNTVSMINPYFVEFGITDRLNADTRFLRGHGFVLEQGFNEAAATAQQESAFNRAFAGNRYVAYSTENIYLNDNQAFIETPSGPSRYMCTIRYNGTDFAIREYPAAGVVYCDKKPDLTFLTKIAVTTDDHQVNYVMLKTYEGLIAAMRYYFERGAFRFRDLQCKEAILKLLSY